MVFQTFNFIQARGLNHLQVYGLLMIQAIIYSKLKDVRLRNNDRFFHKVTKLSAHTLIIHCLNDTYFSSSGCLSCLVKLCFIKCESWVWSLKIAYSNIVLLIWSPWDQFVIYVAHDIKWVWHLCYKYSNSVPTISSNQLLDAAKITRWPQSKRTLEENECLQQRRVEVQVCKFRGNNL